MNTNNRVRRPNVSVTYGSTCKVSFELDTTQSLEKTMNQLVVDTFKLSPHPLADILSTYSLRVSETLELITEEKIQALRVAEGSNLRLGPGPRVLAKLTLASLTLDSSSSELKRTLFQLQKYCKVIPRLMKGACILGRVSQRVWSHPSAPSL